MGRHPYYSVPYRRIPIAAAGGTVVKLSTPDQLSSWRDNWSGLVCTPTANRAVGDTTLTLNTPDENGCETGVVTTAARLEGLLFKWGGSFYRITDQTVGAVITFTPALLVAMTANASRLKIQADLPSLVSHVTIQTTTADLQIAIGINSIADGSFATVFAGQWETVYNDGDNFAGAKADPIFVISGGVATTAELRCFTP
jgi:hypothetical protein